MYHYVRDLRKSEYSHIKGLDISSFRRQLDYLQNNYTFISIADLTDYIKESKPLGENACWLTFDDGYSDHYKYVFPELLSRGLEGAFFPTAAPIVEHEILDVNKIHFILASVNDIHKLVDELGLLFYENNLSQNIGKSFDDLRIELAKPNRFDSAETIFVKRMLQHALPPVWRQRFTDLLFRKYVTNDVYAFAEDLYMTATQLSEMIQAGMYVGSHGYRHLWLGKESKEVQFSEIERSLAFLGTIGAPVKEWVMCYPYGNYNEDTLEILESSGCLAGLTTRVGVTDLNQHTCTYLELPRLDTNDLPR